jgi:hypothetical protein
MAMMWDHQGKLYSRSWICRAAQGCLDLSFQLTLDGRSLNALHP